MSTRRTAQRWVQAALVAMLRVYRVIVSPWLGPACRFEPSCSAYAIEAIEAYGPIRGAGLAVRRLSRCHPFGGHGFDPIPDRSPDGP